MRGLRAGAEATQRAVVASTTAHTATVSFDSSFNPEDSRIQEQTTLISAIAKRILS